MEDNKDLGKLFKERLANAEAEPSSALWSQIEETLEKKRKRRFFIWLWAGVLALLTFSTLSYFAIVNPVNENSDYEQSSETSSPINKVHQKNEPKNETQNHTTITTIENGAKTNGIKDLNTNSTIIEEDREIRSEMPKARDAKATEDSDDLSAKTIRTTKRKRSAKKAYSKKTIVQQQSDSKKNEDFRKQSTSSEKKDANKPKNEKSDAITSNDRSRAINKNDDMNSATQAEEQIVTDSVQKKTAALKKPIPKQKEKPKKKKALSEKFLITLQGGPTLYRNASNTSPFDAILDKRHLKSGLSYSYGALVNIPLSEKFIFRFGYRKTNLKLFAKKAAHIADSINGSYQSIVNSNAIRRNGASLSPNLFDTLAPPNEFEIEQNINYRVFPFEMLYRLKDGKLKVDAILGANILALGKTVISVSSQGGKNELGSAAYLKKISIAPSLGLGLKYQIFKDVSIDLEPTLQYQINAFEKGFKNTNPIIFSISLGTTFKF